MIVTSSFKAAKIFILNLDGVGLMAKLRIRETQVSSSTVTAADNEASYHLDLVLRRW